MNWQDRVSEPLTLEQAASECGIPVGWLRRYVRARPYLLRYEIEAQWRGNWHDEMLVASVFRVYAECNNLNRYDIELGERSAALFYVLANLADAKWNVGVVERPKERLLGMKKRLVRLRATDGEYPPWKKKDAILDRLPRGSIPEFVEACEQVRPDLLPDTEAQRMPRGPSVTETICTIDVVLDRMKRRGPKPNRYRQEAARAMRDDYEWLTGRRPSISNSLGKAKGDFVDFQKAIYPLAGMPEPSDYMLRDRDKKRN